MLNISYSVNIYMLLEPIKGTKLGKPLTDIYLLHLFAQFLQNLVKGDSIDFLSKVAISCYYRDFINSIIKN